jgi:uncharacterized protein YlzI (FlbEa/FlbD family)
MQTNGEPIAVNTEKIIECWQATPTVTAINMESSSSVIFVEGTLDEVVREINDNNHSWFMNQLITCLSNR